ncbi:MAG: hypothetical protein JJU42_04155 [Rhodobacteraceae bacterium]|nr:hypothetical protein [Paracoccaceae bacterium]
MIAPAALPLLLRLSDAAAVLTLAAVAAALLLPDPYAAVPDHLRPGAWSRDTISAPAALALLAVNARLRAGWARGWLIYAYGLYSFDRKMNPDWRLYLAILSLSVFAALMLLRAVDPGAVLGVSVFHGTFYTWALFGGPFLTFDLKLYALMGFGPAALVWPFWRGSRIML